MTETHNRDPGDDGSHEDDADLNIPGPIRRNALLLCGVIGVLLVGPSISRVLSAYRAIVLDFQEDSMLLGLPTMPPKWVDSIEAERGQIVVKERGEWKPRVVDRTPQDHDLISLHDRYNLQYTGKIVTINEPHRPGGASSAVIELDEGGGTIHLELWADHLGAAAPGRLVRKDPGSWDPVLVQDPLPVTQTPPESSPPAGAP